MTKKKATSIIWNEVIENLSYRVGDSDEVSEAYCPIIEALYSLCFITKKRAYISRLQSVYELLSASMLCEQAKILKARIEDDCVEFKINPVRI